MVYSYNEMLFSNEKEQATDTHNMNESHVEQRKPTTIKVETNMILLWIFRTDEINLHW